MVWKFKAVFNWSTDYSCSNCGHVVNIQDDSERQLEDYDYCPQCGILEETTPEKPYGYDEL